MQNEDKKNQREISGGLWIYWLLGYWFIGLLGYCGGQEEKGEEAEEELNWTVNYIVL